MQERGFIHSLEIEVVEGSFVPVPPHKKLTTINTEYGTAGYEECPSTTGIVSFFKGPDKDNPIFFVICSEDKCNQSWY